MLIGQNAEQEVAVTLISGGGSLQGRLFLFTREGSETGTHSTQQAGPRDPGVMYTAERLGLDLQGLHPNLTSNSREMTSEG